ncbi:MAG: pseudouridine synthase [Alphaproteobacteria bacterium]|nr:pseudouridine synthase [Alphaproteobacteria bacterium]
MPDAQGLSADEILARLLYRDGMMLVIDKPAGLPVHRGPQNAFSKGGPNLESSFEALRFGLPHPPVLAHRLDKDTAGCLVPGRNRKATALAGAAGGRWLSAARTSSRHHRHGAPPPQWLVAPA